MTGRQYRLVRLLLCTRFIINTTQQISIKLSIRRKPKPYRPNLILVHRGSKILQYLSKRINNAKYQTLSAEYKSTLIYENSNP